MKNTNDNFLNGMIVALVTPFRSDGQVDLNAWARLIDWHLEAGTHGLVVGGTTGESATLTRSERDRLLDIAVEQADGKIPVLAGTGSASTAQVMADSQRAASLGADAVLVVAPYYNRPPQRGLIAHYRAVADACRVPVVLYNVPSRTATDIHPETTIILSEHPNIIAIKEAVPDMDRVQTLVDAGMMVLSGDDPSALQAMRTGATGVISVIANVMPEAMVALYRAVQTHEPEVADTLQRELEPVLRFISVETNPIPAKWLMAEMGLMEPGLRLPLTELDPEHHAFGHQILDLLKTRSAGSPRSADQRATGS